MCHDGTGSFDQAQQRPADRFVARATAADLPDPHDGVSGSPGGWPPPPVALAARQIGRASDGGSEGTALADPRKPELAFPPRSASRNEEMEKKVSPARS